MSNYHIFARYYDDLTKNIDYKKNSEYYCGLIEKFYGKKGILLDLACGTGSLSEEMARRDFDVIAVDISQEMLSVALDKKYDSGLSIQYICQDMTKLDMYGTIDVTICALDSLNHLADLAEVKSVFEKVSLFAENDGLFIFDMNTPYKHKNILSNNTYTYETKDVFCVWENEQDEGNKIKINLTFFEENEGVYHRFDEFFFENAYEQDEIDRLLIETGFEILAHYDYFSSECVHNTSERITYVARKISR